MLCLFFFIRLEKEYTTIKNKEMEEQIEIKVCVFVFVLEGYHNKHFLKMNWSYNCSVLLSFQRLRTENRLLKQRIETLEKVRAGR